MSGPLGRRPPTDWRHVERYPLTADAFPLKVCAGAIGVNWYREFDSPQRDSAGHYWIARDGRLTRVRGGHCVAVKGRGQSDPVGWWEFYDQGSEGACVGFGSSRMMSLQNRKRYDGFWLYREAQKVDEWPGEAYDGTSVRAAMDVLRERGHRVMRDGRSSPESAAEGISANRWARSIDDFLAAVGYPDKDYVDILNSWGRSGYPHLVRMPATVLERLLFEDGELAIITDR